MSTDRELLDRIAHLESDRDFWKDQQKFAANVAATIADLDEQAPALRQLLRQERDRRKRAESALVTADYARLRAVEQFTAALLTGLDDLERDDHHGTLVRPGDVADLVHRVAAEVGRG